MPSYTHAANFEPYEGNALGGATITFARRVQKLIITNDSKNKDLQYRFAASQNWGTLGPAETLTVDLSVTQVLLNGDADYRVWGFN